MYLIEQGVLSVADSSQPCSKAALTHWCRTRRHSLLASQYSLIDHANALNNVFPVASQCNVKFVIGSSLNAGFISGSPRYNYGKMSWDIPNSGRSPRGWRYPCEPRTPREPHTRYDYWMEANAVIAAPLGGTVTLGNLG